MGEGREGRDGREERNLGTVQLDDQVALAHPGACPSLTQLDMLHNNTYST